MQGNQAQIGEILLTNFANEDPLYELDGLPFLATGYDASFKLSTRRRSRSWKSSTRKA